MLTQIGRDISDFKNRSSNLDHQLSKIQHLIFETRHDVWSHSHTAQSALEPSPPEYSSPIESRSPLSYRRSLKLSEKHPYSEPISHFETSSSFFPETYTLDEQLPSNFLIVVSSYEQCCSAALKTIVYGVFYSKSPRQWCKLNISLDIGRSSTFWAVTEISSRGFTTRSSNTGAPLGIAMPSLPLTLLSQFQNHLSEAEYLDEDVHLRWSLSNDEKVQQKRLEYHDTPSDLLQTATESTDVLCRKILVYLDDLGCPRYFENEVIQIAIVKQPDHYAACVDGMLVLETKLAYSPTSKDAIYDIQVLRSLQGDPGFVKFVGIVVDCSGKHLKSVLLEFPKRKWHLLYGMLAYDEPIPWERRENIARQLVERVSQVHSKGFVVGTLWHPWLPIVVDDSDCIHLFRFDKRFSASIEGGWFYPPEFRNTQASADSMDRTKCLDLTPKIDMFHLGLVLWFIARSLTPFTSDEADTEVIKYYDGSHADLDPIALPRLPESIPQYYRDIIDSCRAEDPDDRPAAWRLLELFSPKKTLEIPLIEEAKPKYMDISSLRNCFRMSFGCNLCGATIQGHNATFFHCNVCTEGNFDLCMMCYGRGMHCDDREHLLIEVTKTDLMNVTRRYHGSMKDSGTRDLIEV